MKLCSVVWGRTTKIEFVAGQNPVMPPLFYPQIKTFIMAPMGSHNSGCTQDRVVIFGSRVRFSGTAYLTASSKFTLKQRNLGQNGYNSAYIRDIREIFVYNRGFRGRAIE